MATKDQVIKRLVKSAKKAMKQLEYAQPETPIAKIWDELFDAVKAAESLLRNSR